MDRKEFMEQLERLLQDIPESERNDALKWYQDYFDEAGAENEQQVIQELGSPWKVAGSIMAGMGKVHDRGEYTEKGYQDPRFQERLQTPMKQGSVKQEKSKVMWILMIILLVFVAQILFGIGGGLLGVIFGILGTLIGILGAIFGGIVACVAGGIGRIAAGVAECFVHLGNGFVMIGGGMICIAIGLIFITLLLWLGNSVLPNVFQTIKSFVLKVWKRGKDGDAHEEIS